MGNILLHGFGEPVLLLIGGVPFLLGLHWSLLSECGERDLATAIFDARPPCARLPYAEFTGVTFQRFDDQPAVLFAQVVFVRLLPIVVLGIPTVVACT